MQKLSKLLVGIGIIAAIVAVGILVGWWGSSGPAPRVTAPVEPAPVATSPVANTPPTPIANGPAVPPAPVNPTSGAPVAVVAPEAARADLITNWEDRVDDILSSDSEDTNKVQELFAMFPHLPEDGQVEVAQHLSNLVPDEDYAPLGKLLEDAKLPDGVLDVLMSDVLNRPNSEKLPTLLDVAQNPDHSKAGEAKDLLELYLDEDYGTDWAKWRQGVQQWLKDNPD